MAHLRSSLSSLSRSLLAGLRVPARRRTAAVLACPLFLTASGQSLKQAEPAHLVRGLNRGTLDSAFGNHYWDFYVSQGRFQLVFAGDSPQQVFKPGHQPEVHVTFLPSTEGAVLTRRAIPGGGTVFIGTVLQRTHVGVVVEPVKDSQGRETTDYTLVVNGNLDFADTTGKGGGGR